MDEFQISTKKVAFQTAAKSQQNAMVITLKGILDTTTADELNKLFTNCFSQRIHKFIVDLSELSHIGSAGIGVFIGILDILEDNKGTLVFVHPTPKVKASFNLFRLATFYSITDNNMAALKELQALSR